MQGLKKAVQTDLGNRFGAHVLRLEIRAVDRTQVQPVQRDAVAQQPGLYPCPRGRIKLRATIGNQQDDPAAGVRALLELLDRSKHGAPNVRVRQPAADAAGSYSRLDDLIVLRERHDGQRAGAEEHQGKAVIGALCDELREQIPRRLALLRTVVPGLLRADQRIDLAPVRRQHAQVHAAAPIDQHQDLGSVTGTGNLRLGHAGTAE